MPFAKAKKIQNILQSLKTLKLLAPLYTVYRLVTTLYTDWFKYGPVKQLILNYNKRNIELKPKSLYISHEVSNFYGTEIEIWSGFGPDGNTGKNFGPIMSNIWEFFHVFMGKRKLVKQNNVASALKIALNESKKKS